MKRSDSRTQLVATEVGQTTKRRCASLALLASEQEREGRDGLSEPHVVGENSSGAERLEKLEPRQAETLVRAEGCAKAPRHLGLRGDRERAEAATKRFHGGVDATVVLFDPSVESPKLVGRQARGAAVHHFLCFLGEVLDRRRDLGEGAVLQGDPPLFAGEGRANGVELDADLARAEIESRIRPVSLERHVHAARNGCADAHLCEALGQLDLDGRVFGGSQVEEPALPERDGLFCGDGRLAGEQVALADLLARHGSDEPGPLCVRSRASLALQIAAVLPSVALEARRFAPSKERHLASRVAGNELRLEPERLAGQTYDDSRCLERRQAERLARRHRDPAPARGPKEARARVFQLSGRNEENGSLRKLTHEVEVDVAPDPMNRAAQSPDVGERTGEERRLREGDSRRPVVGDPERRQSVERAFRLRAAGGAEGDDGPDQRGTKIEEPLETQGEDPAVRPHRLDGERGIDAQRVSGLAPRPTIAHVLEDAAIARREARGRGDFSSGQELSVTGQTHDDGESSRRPRIRPIAVRAAHVTIDLGERTRGHFDPRAARRRRKPGFERAAEVELEVPCRADGRGASGCLGGAATRSERVAQLRGASQVDGQNGDVRARPERL